MEKVRKMRRPQFIIFTDKDGTLNLDDRQLNSIMRLIHSIGGMVVPVTGRTVGDIKEEFKRGKIDLPKLIVGDNGANVYWTETGDFIIRKTLDSEKIRQIVEHYLQIGGNPDLIRYTDGERIFASSEETVKDYYAKSTVANSIEGIEDEILQSGDVTKITLTGPKEQMQEMAGYVQKLGFWSDMDKTKFPVRTSGNYRLDIAQKGINKGEAVKAIVGYFKPQYGYMCVGNGNNDLAMFKQAIDDGMEVDIMGDADETLIGTLIKYSKSKGKGKVFIIPKDRNRANRIILKRAKIFQESMVKGRKRALGKKRKKDELANKTLGVRIGKRDRRIAGRRITDDGER